jgi:alkylation response protein AidB-like acyl-CoA dehydrogenase
VKFSFSSEQEEFRSNLRRLLADHSPTKEVRRLMETDRGYERDGWRAINTALGLTAIRIPEAYGGYGFGFGDQCIVLEEMGRALLCAPYFATAVLATCAIMNAGTEAEKQGAAAGHRCRRDDRDLCLGRGYRELGRRGHGADRDRRKRRSRAERA